MSRKTDMEMWKSFQVELAKIKPKYVECVCGNHLLKLECMDWAYPETDEYEHIPWNFVYPGVFLSFWEVGNYSDNRRSFLDRLKNAYKEFKGKLTKDDLVIHKREKLIEFRDALNQLIEEWGELEKLKEKYDLNKEKEEKKDEALPDDVLVSKAFEE